MLFLAVAAFANEAAPYSEEANERLTRIQRNMQAPDIKTSNSQKNVANYLEHLKKLYVRADYDFPRSLAEYYQDHAERNGVPETRHEAQLMADNVATLHSLMAGMSAEDAFPGNEYQTVRLAYKRLRALEQGVKLSDDEIALAKKRRTDADNAKYEKLKKETNQHELSMLAINVGLVVGLVIVGSCLIGYVMSPFWVYFRRKKLAAKEQAAPYVYIKKHGHYPEMQDKDK